MTQSDSEQQQVELFDGERIDDLQYNGLKIIQNKDYYCFSSDAILLCNFVKAKKSDTIVDLCSGSGVVGILAQAKTNAKKLVMVEKQTELFEMCQKSIKLNCISQKAEVINCDAKDAPTILGNEKFDVVCANPPYYLTSEKKLSGNSIVDIAKFEIELSFDDLCKSAEKLLKFGGRFFFVNDSARIAEILTTLKKHNLEPKVIQFVFPSKRRKHNEIDCDQLDMATPSNVVLIEAIKRGKSGAKVFYRKI